MTHAWNPLIGACTNCGTTRQAWRGEDCQTAPNACPHCGLRLSIALAAHVRHCELRPDTTAQAEDMAAWWA